MTHQAIRLGYFPRLTVLHTSGAAEGQIYLPLMNWGLAIACMALVLIFRESGRLAAAFGLAVSGTMLLTSLIFYMVVRHSWGWSRLKAGGILFAFLAVDVPFVVANSLKFFDGGYLPFLVGAFFVAVMVIWRMGRTLVADYFASLSRPVDQFLAEVDRKCIARVPGTAVFLSSQPAGVPSTLVNVVDRFRVVHEHTVILTVVIEHVPHVSAAGRLETAELGPGLRRVIARYGFMDDPDVPADAKAALAGTPGPPVFVMGRETFVGTERNRMGRISESLFDVLSRNARKASDDFGIPPEQVVELGTHVDL
jgi:KUP system potassium uptake protein